MEVTYLDASSNLDNVQQPGSYVVNAPVSNANVVESNDLASGMYLVVVTSLRDADGNNWTRQDATSLSDRVTLSRYTYTTKGWSAWVEVGSSVQEPLGISASTDLSLDMIGRILESDSGSDVELTIPSDDDASFPVGVVFNLVRQDTGEFTVVAGDDVTLNSVGGDTSIAAQYGAATLYKRDDNEWVLFGNLYTPA